MALIVALVLLCGCSGQPKQRVLARLNEADRVTVLRPDDGATMTLTDEHLKKLVQAIDSAKRIDKEGLCATPGPTLVFYKASVHLVTVATAADLVFFIDDVAYHDESGTLSAVGASFREKNPRK